MSDHKRVTAIFENRTKAVNAIHNLERMGYRQDKLTLLVAENSWNSDKNIKIEQNTKAPEGAAVGAGVGATIGALVAGLTTVGTVVATGGVGLLVAGPLVAALTGAGAGGAAGGIVGGLIGFGMPEVEAKYVDQELGKGSVMIAVETDPSRVDEVRDSLASVNAKKVSVH